MYDTPRTVHTYAQRLANNERSHIKQIERIVTMTIAEYVPTSLDHLMKAIFLYVPNRHLSNH